MKPRQGVWPCGGSRALQARPGVSKKLATPAPAEHMARMQEVAAAAEPAPAEHYELDQWLLDFANLFREVLNVEPERHLDLTQIGWERLQARSCPSCLHLLSMPCHVLQSLDTSLKMRAVSCRTPARMPGCPHRHSIAMLLKSHKVPCCISYMACFWASSVVHGQ